MHPTVPWIVLQFEFLVTHLWIFLHYHNLHAFQGNRHLVHALREAVDNLFTYWKSNP